MSKKREVRDARFRDREPEEPPKPKAPRPKASPTPSQPPPSRPRPPAPDVEPAPAEPSTPLPAWLSPNLIVPALMAVFLGWALYEKFGPFTHPSAADAGAGDAATASADAAAAPDAPAAAPADTGAAAVVVDAAPAVPRPNEGEALVARTQTPVGPDPAGGRFTMAQATANLPGTGALHADIETTMGTFDCTLLEREAPINTANFIGLARGLRDFWDPVAGAWTKRPFYDGSIFHRVIPDFMIQGGDQLRSGTGDTGYELPDENVRPHDAAGLLCMANHGPNTASAQFFITEVAKPHLDGSYSILGRCTPTDLVNRIARVPRNDQDRPNAPVHILHVRIRRG